MNPVNSKYKILLFVISILLAHLDCSTQSKVTDTNSSKNEIIILYTNDEHGWMEPTETYSGAAGLMGQWIEKEGNHDDSPFLILSGGDMWTGPAISTWFSGKPMVEVMNAMGYDAAAIGNHEFDFEVKGLKRRISELNFPLLSANIREKASGNIPDFAIPYIIKFVGDIPIGLIGLSSTSTPYSTFPDYVKDFDFIDYEPAIREFISPVKEDGAEIIIVIGHIGYQEMLTLVPLAKELGIKIIAGGHTHELVAENVDGVTIIEGGSFFQSYAKAIIKYDVESDAVTSVTSSVHFNQGNAIDPTIEAIVQYWQTRADSALSEEIGFADPVIERNSNAMYNMVTDSWFFSIPTADVSITNRGGIRQSIPSGEITKGTIVGLLPFNNSILELDLSGGELIDCIGYDLIVGGMTTIGGYKLDDGTDIHIDSIYQVLTTDYLYSRSDYNFKKYDPFPYNTAILYRQPVIDWIKSLDTDQDNPLNNYLDTTPRQ